MSSPERIEAKWIASFVELRRLCGVQAGDACAVLSETQSRQSLVQLSELALAQLGARWFHLVLPTPRQTAPAPLRSTGALVGFDGRAQLAAIAVPTLVITGECDATAPPELARRMAQRIAGAQSVILAGAGHLLTMEQPDAFNTAVLAFLQRH